MTAAAAAPLHLLRAACALSLLFLAAGCGSEEGHGSGGPAAPTNLRATLVAGGAHLTWEDNADDETEFIVMRRPMSATMYDTVATVPFDTLQYHDAAVTAGTTYLYHVMAINDAGESASNEITFSVP